MNKYRTEERRTFEIVSKKHDGRLHRKWVTNRLFHSDDRNVIAANYRTIVIEQNNDKWCTVDPAISYFHQDYWFNVIIIFQGSTHYYYCNLASPYKWKDQTLTYIDYDIDVIVAADYTYEIVDRMEFIENSNKLSYPIQIKREVERAIVQLQEMIRLRKGPFHPRFVEKWRGKLQQYITDTRSNDD